MNLLGGYQYVIRSMTIVLSPYFFPHIWKQSLGFRNILIATKPSLGIFFIVLKTLVTKGVRCPIPQTSPFTPPPQNKMARQVQLLNNLLWDQTRCYATYRFTYFPFDFFEIILESFDIQAGENIYWDLYTNYHVSGHVLPLNDTEFKFKLTLFDSFKPYYT